jgi:hypothetical protein
MTKREYQAKDSQKPLGDAGIAKMRDIMKNGYSKVNSVTVDSYSASAVIAVFDKLNPENQAKLKGLTVQKAVSVCFKLLNKQS